MRTIKVDIGGESKEFPLGVSILLYGYVASGKTTFCLTLAREFLKNNLPCIWLCLDESPNSLREKMEYFKVDYKRYQDSSILRFIDAYSEQITGKPLEDPYVINCSSAFNLNELNRTLMTALSEIKGQGIVVFDSVSTLLLYNAPGTCEEFLKVHMSRVTSAGFTSLYIMQRELHAPQTEETLKMMCDAVLDFGFEEDKRKIGVLKLPLGQSGDWIESSLFAWQQAPGITVSKPAGPRKYLDSGGYIEDLKEGLVEGLREGLANVKLEAPGTVEGRAYDAGVAGGEGAGAGGEGGGAGEGAGAGGEGGGAGEGAAGGAGGGAGEGDGGAGGVAERFERIVQSGEGGVAGAGEANAQTRGVGGGPPPVMGRRQAGGQPGRMQFFRETPQPGGPQAQQQAVIPKTAVQHIDKQIIVTQLSGLPDKLGGEIKKLINEQLKLREVIHEKEELTRESRKRLDTLVNKEVQTIYEVREIEERGGTITKTLESKRKTLTELEQRKTAEEEKYREAVKRQDALKAKIDRILSQKKVLENKIHDIISDSGELYIDLAPYLQEVLSKQEKQVAESRDNLNALDVKIQSVKGEVQIMDDEMTETVKRRQDKTEELKDVRDRKAKVESELSLITTARSETEKKLKKIMGKKQKLEEKLKKLVGESG